MPFWGWSRTAASNNVADSTINWQEGQPPSSVNDSARAMMARLSEWRDDLAGATTTAGNLNAYTLSTYQGFDTLAHMNGARLAFTPHVTNGATVTINVDSLGAKPLRTAPGVELNAGVLISGTPYHATYNNGTGEWILSGLYGNPFNLPIGGVLPYLGSTAPNSLFVLPYGQNISRTTYATLWALMGSPNTGDGSTTFTLPDMRGRVIAGWDSMGGTPSGRLSYAASGVDGTTISATGGFQSLTLAQANLPNVTLTFTGNSVTPTFAGGTVTPTFSGSFSGNSVTPTFTGNSVTPTLAGSGPTFSGNSVTPTLAGSGPTFSGNSVTPTFSGSSTTPTFTGSAVTSGGMSANSSHTHSASVPGYAGASSNVSPKTFNSLTNSVVDGGPLALPTTGSADISHTHTITAAGTISSITPAGTISSFTPSGTITDNRTINALTPAGTITDTRTINALTPSGTISSLTPAGTISGTISSVTFTGTISTITPAGTISALGSGTAFSIAQPTIVLNLILRII